MPYTAERPANTPPLDEVRSRIPGWGVDRDYDHRPAVPQEEFDPSRTGAHWHFPERQPELWPRERSIEHEQLTPVFGTSCPLKGVSGVIRRYAYRFGEGTSSHWLILMAADRVDVIESAITSTLRGRPDNPITETGVAAEFKRHGLASRLGRHRVDLKHQPLDLLIVSAPWVLAGYAGYRMARALRGDVSADDQPAAPASVRRRGGRDRARRPGPRSSRK